MERARATDAGVTASCCPRLCFCGMTLGARCALLIILRHGSRFSSKPQACRKASVSFGRTVRQVADATARKS